MKTILGMSFPVVVVAAIFVFSWLFSCINILKEYERGVIFRLGRVLPQPKGPGLIFVFKPFDSITRVALRTIVLDVPPQDIITKDNVSVKVNAVVYFRVFNPLNAILQVENYIYATSQLSQTTLRSILGQVELDDLLSEREKLNKELQTVLDQHTDPWGIKVALVEIKQVDLPQDMQGRWLSRPRPRGRRGRRSSTPTENSRRPSSFRRRPRSWRRTRPRCSSGTSRR